MKGKDHGRGTRQKPEKFLREIWFDGWYTEWKPIWEVSMRKHLKLCHTITSVCVNFWDMDANFGFWGFKRRGTFDDEARVSMGGPWEQKFLFHSSLMQEERMFVTKKINYNNSPDSTLPKNSTKPNGMGWWHTVVSPQLFFWMWKLRLDVDTLFVSARG